MLHSANHELDQDQPKGLRSLFNQKTALTQQANRHQQILHLERSKHLGQDTHHKLRLTWGLCRNQMRIDSAQPRLIRRRSARGPSRPALLRSLDSGLAVGSGGFWGQIHEVHSGSFGADRQLIRRLAGSKVSTSRP